MLLRTPVEGTGTGRKHAKKGYMRCRQCNIGATQGRENLCKAFLVDHGVMHMRCGVPLQNILATDGPFGDLGRYHNADKALYCNDKVRM